MNARELLDDLESGLIDEFMSAEVKAIYIRALRLLAAAEANDGTTAETDIARAIDQLNLVAVGLEPTFSVSAKWVKGAIALIEALRNERNGLAARVGELEHELRRLTKHHPECVCSTCLNERTKEWFLVSDDAARSKP